MSVANEIFLCHSSYEPRCLSLVSRLKDETFNNAIVFGSARWELNEVYRGHHQDLVENLQLKTTADVVSIILERRNKIGFLEELHANLQNADDDSQILVDISTFPRDRLLMVLKYLSNQFQVENINLHHCSPESYATENTDESSWLAKGVKQVAAVPGFNGLQKSRSGCFVILQLGHERERPQITATSLEPDKVAILHQGHEQYKSSTSRMSHNNNLVLLDTFDSKITESTKVSYNDWSGAKKEICRIYEKYHNNYNIYISPNGTKIQLLGALAAVLKYPEMQIRYAEPQIYNTDSSFGVGKVWECNLGLILSD